MDGEEASAEIEPYPLSHYVRWLINSVVSEGARRSAPLGAAWIRARLATGGMPSVLNPAAVQLRELDAQRTSRTSTNFRVDTSQTTLIRQTTSRLLTMLERIDISATSGAGCGHTFSTTAALATRRDHWRTQINTLASTHQAALIDWIVGKQTFSANSTIKAATDEALKQIECMRTAINAVRSSQSLADPKSRGPTRDFDRQLCIWMWKYGFTTAASSLNPPCSSGSTWTFGSMMEGTVRAVHTAMPSNTAAFNVGDEWGLGGTLDATHRTAWTSHLTSDQREREILQTSSAPGISRHHWGTDVDYGSVSGSTWRTNTAHGNLYRWLQTNAMAFGMVQVYTPDRPGYTSSSPRTGYDGYIEERWHWSYYPVAQALLDWANTTAHKALILARLQQIWGDVRTGTTYAAARTALGWTSSTNPFSYIETNWENYVFNVNRHVTPPIV